MALFFSFNLGWWSLCLICDVTSFCMWHFTLIVLHVSRIAMVTIKILLYIEERIAGSPTVVSKGDGLGHNSCTTVLMLNHWVLGCLHQLLQCQYNTLLALYHQLVARKIAKCSIVLVIFYAYFLRCEDIKIMLSKGFIYLKLNSLPLLRFSN